ncbi:HEAT repeat domain-containing protein [Aliifodinibius salicampi]|uniref:HEAT repeat domain-containing protein n=1 Tax=Fodinibius salicampi TaxID=1920655 RepID=A0ABT3PWG1_9BACT|nr:HEAT repeat domain-containing protein [Fodinibius salicampi]MCW9712199.1 HEAT repeat domain-containing protein [Fodinibius salicampi]
MNFFRINEICDNPLKLIRKYSISKTFLLALLLLFTACSSEEQPTPEVITLEDTTAAEEANEVRNEVSAELAEDLNLSLWASEQLLGDPIGLDITDNGEALINVTNRSTSSEFDIRGHRDWMIESISWETVEDRKNFLHETLSPENSEKTADFLEDYNEDGSHDWRDLTVEKEEIYRISDQSGDGIADRSELYLRDFHSEETDVAGSVYEDGEDVYVAVAPDMWRTQDKNGDGIADSKTSISSGYAVHIGFSGHGMSGITKGPDGRIYWSIGDIGLNVEGPDGKQWEYPNQGAILRSDPDGSNFEVYAAGVRNTHEFTFDKYGNLISVDNDGDHAGEHERLVYLINGSDSGWRANWQYGKYVDPKNNDYKVWMDENYFKPRFEGQAAHILPPIAPYHSGPAGMTYNPGTGLSEQWKDHFFVAEFVGSPSGSAIHAFSLEPKGASFELKTNQPIMEGVLATGLDFGPEGSLYFADWIEGWGTKDKGRIWKIDSEDKSAAEIQQQTKQLLAENFGERPEEELLELMGHADMRVRMKAQFELVDRSSKQSFIDAINQTENQLARLHGIWGIGQLARDNPEEAEVLIDYLSDSDPEVRAQAAKTIGDVRYEDGGDALLSLLEDESMRVQLLTTEALGRIAYEPAFSPIVDMLEAHNDEDVYLRHAGAIAMERIGNTEAVAKLADHSSEAVRIAAVVALKRMESPEVARFLSDESEFVVTNAARAINDDALLKDALPELAAVLDQQQFTNTPLLRRAINASLFNGTAEDADRLASFATREGVSDSLRSEAIATLSVWPDPSTLDRVTGRHRGEISNNRQDAVDAISGIIEPLFEGNNEIVKVAVVEAVSSLNMQSEISRLYTLLQNDPSAEVKIASIEALSELNFDKIAEAVDFALSTDQEEVRMTALGIIPELDIQDQEKANLLASVLEGNTTDEEQQSALKALGTIQTESAYTVLENQFDKLLADNISPAIQLELVQAAENSDSEELQSLLEQYEEAKPEDNPIAEYQEALYGGDSGSGARIFYRNNAAQCVRCHAVGGNGGSVGPDLANIGNTLNREQLLESMVAPDARIAPGYGSVEVTLENGETISGVLKEESDAQINLQSADGETHQVSKDQITNRENSPSAMFSMEEILSKNELRDLVEYLSQLQETNTEEEEQGHGQ